MNIDSSDVKFFLSYLGAAILFWKTASWVTRKQVIVENFLSDIRDFMKTASVSLERIETNHLVHIQEALSGRKEYVEVVSQNTPLEDIHDAVQES